MHRFVKKQFLIESVQVFLPLRQRRHLLVLIPSRLYWSAISETLIKYRNSEIFCLLHFIRDPGYDCTKSNSWYKFKRVAWLLEPCWLLLIWLEIAIVVLSNLPWSYFVFRSLLFTDGQVKSNKQFVHNCLTSREFVTVWATEDKRSELKAVKLP